MVTFPLVTPIGDEKPIGNQPSHTEKMSSNSNPSQKVGTELST